jgi:pimeloyl-ACP methyl ester carboxylesterase
VAVIVHGWNSSNEAPWVLTMAAALSGVGRTVLSIDWRDLASSTLPSPSAYNVPKVANDAFALLNGRVNPGSLHLIGHSHGAHVAGLIGKRFGGQVKRITALDPSEEMVHDHSDNRNGTGWGRSISARFIDSYKCSEIAGGETAWGDDNFVLAGGPGNLYAGHSGGLAWLTSTIQAEADRLRPGFWWDRNSWRDLLAQLPQVHGSPLQTENAPWKGIVLGNVIECLTIGTEIPQTPNRGTWKYPGAWPGAFNGGEQVRRMIDGITMCVQMGIPPDTVHVESADSHNNIWQVGKGGIVSYTIQNAADNTAIPENCRKLRQFRYGQGIVDSFWLSDDPVLDPKIDLAIDTHRHSEEAEFLPCAGERPFNVDVRAPSADTIRSHFPGVSWPEGELSPAFYLIVDGGSSQSTCYAGELYPDNSDGAKNWAGTEIFFYEGLCAHAGDYPEPFTVDSEQDTVLVALDGTKSGPKKVIGTYEWSIGLAGSKVTYAFGVGTHTVTLTVTDRNSGESDSDEATVVVRLKDPRPEGDPEDSDDLPVYTSYTPEDKFGPAGYDAAETPEESKVRFIAGGELLEYRIEFWNKEDALVPTQDAIIEDTLDSSVFDLKTLKFTRFGFLKWDVALKGGQAIDTRVDLRPDMGVAVQVSGTFDSDTGKIRWWFHCVDPETGEYPENPMVGFLPPFNPDTGFEIGWVEFTVEPRSDLPTGAQVLNQAFVEFDFAGDLYQHPAPKAGPWLNTIDAGPPTSHVLPLPAVATQSEFLVEWEAEDDAGGSGVAQVDIYVSIDGGPFELWLRSAEASALFAGDPGHCYQFYSVARDNVGHSEDVPTVADARTCTGVLYLLEATVERGEGTVEPASGVFGQGAVVNLTAHPTQGWCVAKWRGTDNDSSIATTNAVTMTSDKAVSVAFGRCFRRGDVNDDAKVNIGDPIKLLSYLFADGPEPACQDAADGNDDGTLNIADAVYLLSYLFASGPLSQPGETCGADPKNDTLPDCGTTQCK